MILAKFKAGTSFQEWTQAFQLSTHTIQRRKKNPERKKRIVKLDKIDNDLLKADVEAYPNDYQWKQAQRLGCSQNAIGTVLNQRLFAEGLYDCSINSDVFHGWVKQ